MNNFINFEDEITLRLSIRAAFKHEGFKGLNQILGELSRSIEIVLEVYKELQEDKKGKF